ITELPKSRQIGTEKTKLSLQDILEVKVLAVSCVALLTAFAYSGIMSFITAFSESKQLLAYTSVFLLYLRLRCCWYGRGSGKSMIVRDQVLSFILPLFSLRLA